MRVRGLYAELEKLIPPELSMEWDNDGLMVCPNPDREVTKVLLTLDVTAAAVDFAIEKSCETIISHHPLIFKPLKHISDKRLLKLVKNDISVMSFHTRLDIVDGGVNDELAKTLGLTEIEKYGELARIGRPHAEMQFDEYAGYVGRKLGALVVNVVKCRETVGRVMVTGGDGKDFYRDAKSSGVGTYITGAMSYNTMADAYDDESAVNIIEAGHYHTEQPVLKALKRMLVQISTDIETIEFESNPVITIGE